MNELLPVAPDLAEAMPALLTSLIGRHGLIAVGVEQLAPSSVSRSGTECWRPLAFGLSVFLDDACADAYLAAPEPYHVLWLLERWRDPSRFKPMTLDEVAAANAGDGLTLSPLVWLQRSFDMSRPEVRVLSAIGEKTLLRLHAGYHLKRILKEGPGHSELAYRNGGLRLIRELPAGSPMSGGTRASPERRVLMELTREQASAAPGSALGHLFTFQPPRCRFTFQEQCVLELARDGQTDHEIAVALDTSGNAIKERWRSIQDRVASAVPSVLGSDAVADRRVGVRGPEKRRRILAFVNEHPQELRPWKWG